MNAFTASSYGERDPRCRLRPARLPEQLLRPCAPGIVRAGIDDWVEASGEGDKGHRGDIVGKVFPVILWRSPDRSPATRIRACIRSKTSACAVCRCACMKPTWTFHITNSCRSGAAWSTWEQKPDWSTTSPPGQTVIHGPAILCTICPPAHLPGFPNRSYFATARRPAGFRRLRELYVPVLQSANFKFWFKEISNPVQNRFPFC